VPVALERHDRVGFRRAQTTIEVQVPLEERSGASKVDVQVQSEGDLIFGKCLSDTLRNATMSSWMSSYMLLRTSDYTKGVFSKMLQFNVLSKKQML
jgi:hypothetical protein